MFDKILILPTGNKELTLLLIRVWWDRREKIGFTVRADWSIRNSKEGM